MGIGLYVDASDVQVDNKVKGFQVRFYPRFSPSANVVRDPEVFHKPFPAGHKWVGLEILRIVRDEFRNFAVVLWDENVDKESRGQVYLENLPSKVERKEVEGPPVFIRPPEKEPRRKYLIVNVGVIDMFGLVNGFVDAGGPAVYYYCAGREPLRTRTLAKAVSGSADQEEMLKRLVQSCDIVLYPGPDAFHFSVKSKDGKALQKIRFRVIEP